jgi:hypothetical protein
MSCGLLVATRTTKIVNHFPRVNQIGPTVEIVWLAAISM